MSTNNNRFTITYNEQTGRYHIENASDNPLYNRDIQLATEMASLDAVDRTVNEWIDCVDAEAIWQDMKKSVDSEGK